MNGTRRYGQPSPLVRNRRRLNWALAADTERVRLFRSRDERALRGRYPLSSAAHLRALARSPWAFLTQLA
jgi:hypothetical protein